MLCEGFFVKIKMSMVYILGQSLGAEEEFRFFSHF